MQPTIRATEARVHFPSAGTRSVSLEGLLGTFDERSRHPAAILCHPGIQDQTGMEYPVIAACSARLHQSGFVTLRFNFRGVQGSEGQRSGGHYETNDVHGAIRYLRQRDDVHPDHVYLVGNSFGAWMAVEAWRDDERLAGLVCIVLPLSLLPTTADFLRADRRPKLFIAAERDQFCDLSALKMMYEQWAAPKSLIVIEESDHFLGIGPSRDPVDRSEEIARAVALWLRALANAS